MKPDIDNEFASLIPPLAQDELDQLEENLLAEGCRDALVVWGSILIDGHNRLSICEKHGIPYNTVEREFSDRDDAMIYIIKNQFGRRNLNPAGRSLLALKLEPMYRAKAKQNQRLSPGRGKKGSGSLPNLFSNIDAREEAAKAAGVSSKTLDRVREIVSGGTDEQLSRIKKGGKGNSVSAVYNEVRANQAPSPVAGSQHCEDIPQSAGVAEDPKASLARIRGYVADLKNPDLDRTLTTDMFLMEYAAFVERTVRSLETFSGDGYEHIYPNLKSKERKKMVSMNEAIIEAVQNSISLCGGHQP